MSNAPTPGPTAQHVPVPWWMPHESSSKRLGVFAAVCLSVVLGVAVGLCAMHRLHKWLRRRYDGEPSAGEPRAGQPKCGEAYCESSLKGASVAALSQGIQSPATSVAVGGATWLGPRHGVLLGNGSASSSVGTTTTLPAATQTTGVDRDSHTAGSLTQPLTLHETNPFGRVSFNGSRHDSSRSFPTGDCGSGFHGPRKGAVGLLDMPPGLPEGQASVGRTDCSSGIGDGGDGCRKIRRGASGAMVTTAAQYSDPEAAVHTAAATAQGEPVGAAVAEAGATQAAAFGLIGGGSGASASTGESGVEACLTRGVPPVRASRRPREVAAQSLAPPLPHQSLAAQQPGGGTYAVPPLFESYREREIEQRLRKVVFGSLNEHSTASAGVPPCQSTCGELDSRRHQQHQQQQQQQQPGLGGVGGTLSLELTLRWSPVAPAAPTSALGCGASADPPPTGPIRAGVLNHSGQAAPACGVDQSMYPGGLHYSAGGGSGVALSARDLLLGHTTSAAYYSYGDCRHRLRHHSIAAQGLTAGLPPQALPLLTAAVSVPAPQAQQMDDSLLSASAKTDASRVQVAPSQTPSQQVQEMAAAATLGAWNVPADVQGGMVRQEIREAQKGMGEERASTEPGSGPGAGWSSASTPMSMPVPEDVVTVVPFQQDTPPPPPQPSDCLPFSTFSFNLLHLAENEAVVPNGGPESSGSAAPVPAAPNEFVNAATATAPYLTEAVSGSAPSSASSSASASSANVGNHSAAAVGSSLGSSRAHSSGGGSHIGGPPQCTVAAVLACLAGEDLEQELSKEQQRHPKPPAPQLAPLEPPQHTQPQQEHDVEPKVQSGLSAVCPQPPKVRPLPKLQSPRQLKPGKAAWRHGVLAEGPVQQGTTAGSPMLEPRPDEECLPIPDTATIGAAGALPMGQVVKDGIDIAVAGSGAVDFAEGRTERLWGLRRSNSNGNNRGSYSRRARFTGMAAAPATSAVAGVAAALSRGSSGSLCKDWSDVDEGGLLRRGVAQLKSGQQTGAGEEDSGWASPAGATVRETQLGSRGQLQLTLMAPRVWPASGAAGLDGPLAKCVAERLMTHNPLFKSVHGGVTPGSPDSGTEDD